MASQFAENSQFTASVDIDKGQCLFVDGSGDFVPTTAASDGDTRVAFATDSFAVGDEAACTEWGHAPAIAGAEIDAGDYLMPAAGGKVVTFVATTGNVKVGQAFTGAAADGDPLEVRVPLVKDVEPA